MTASPSDTKDIGPRKDDAVLKAAVDYTRRGWKVVPIRTGEKRPEGAKWQRLRLSENELRQHFKPGANIGVLLGEASNGLIDIDLDAPEATVLAPHFLPQTGAIFGRQSKAESHWLYALDVAAIPSTTQYEDAEGTMLVELRSTGSQTVFPPSVHPSGEVVEWSVRSDPAQVEAEVLIRSVGKLAAAVLLARNWPQRGARNKTALALLGGLFRAGWDIADVQQFVTAVAEAAGDEEAEDRVLSAASTRDKIERDEEVTGWPSLSDLLGKEIVNRVTKWLGVDKSSNVLSTRNDLGNAIRFERRFGEDFKWSAELGWLAWDETRWWNAPVAEQLARAKAEEVVADLMREAMTMDDADQQKKAFAWAISSGMSGHIDGMVKIARTQGRILAPDRSAFDHAALLLNCRNGTLDLETKVLRPHRRDDMLTKRAEVEWDSKATDPEWDKLLHDSLKGHDDVHDYLQQAAGISLTGLPDEEKLFFVYGDTATGKSTFVQALRAMLGDYAVTVDFETFLKKKGDAGVRNDIARLPGARFVPSIEVAEGKELAENVVKSLTGGDVISARFLYKEFFEFLPTFKLWLVANNRPHISADDAIWRRIHVVPFDNVVPVTERDPRLKKHLTTSPRARSAILAWAVEGYQQYRRVGRLVPPPSVVSATEQYRKDTDTFMSFVNACCDLQENAKTQKPTMRRAYVSWCEGEGCLPLGSKRFKERMVKLKVTESASQGTDVWVGIKLRYDPAQDAEL